MFHTLRLLLPALVPSWRFFDTIAASPRIQYAVFDAEQHIVIDWQEFRPRPTHTSLLTLVERLFWNPQWNESLFMMSCAERIMENYTAHSEDEILTRIGNHYLHDQLSRHTTAQQFQFRLLFIERHGANVRQDIRFVSRLATLPRTPS
jgi:hypothetical protein